MNKTNSIDCYACKHFFVTWDAARPKGCRAFGFKTTKMPSVVVLETSGEPCLKFEAKPNRSDDADQAQKPQTPKRPKKPKRGWTA